MATTAGVRYRRWAAIGLAWCALAACRSAGGRDDRTTPTSLTPSAPPTPTTAAQSVTPTTAVPVDPTPPGTDTTCSTPGTDSRADFDPQEGQYAAYLYGANFTTRAVAFDVVQLPGVANDADPGTPRSHTSIVNALDRTDHAVVSPDARIRIPRYSPSQQRYVLAPGTFDDLLPGRSQLAFLAFRGGTVTDVCLVPTDGPRQGYRTATGPAPGSEASCPTGTSRPDFDPRSGSYAVYLYLVDVTRRVVAFDVVQFVADPGADNDYDVRNEVVHADEAVVADGAAIWVLAAGENGAPVYPVRAELGDLRTYPGAGRHPGYGLYRLTLAGSMVTGLCQVYTP